MATVRTATRIQPILVAGGAGFLGRHLTRKLLAAGRSVLCVDNFCTSEEQDLTEFATEPRFSLLRADIASLDIGRIQPVAAVFNLACPASPVQYDRLPRATLFSSFLGVDHLLQVARRDSAVLVQASTSEVYGHPVSHPQEETHWGLVNTLGPRACYDEGKRCAETLCHIYRTREGVDARIARIFNTYGPGMMTGDGRVIINFVSQALNRQPLTIHGDGSQTRSFCYVDDLIDGLLRLWRTRAVQPGPVNLGNPAEITVGELARRVIGVTGSASTVVFRDLPVDDPPRRCPDITRARQLLGWAPQTDLDTGLRLTMADIRRRMSGSTAVRVHGIDSLPHRTVAAAFDWRVP